MLNVDTEEKQQSIECDRFCEIFSFIYADTIYYEQNIETQNFKYWRYGDDLYILRKTDNLYILRKTDCVLAGLYKHLGCINVANEQLKEKDYIEFANQFKQELVKEGVLTNEEFI